MCLGVVFLHSLSSLDVGRLFCLGVFKPGHGPGHKTFDLRYQVTIFRGSANRFTAQLDWTFRPPAPGVMLSFFLLKNDGILLATE